ncbi:hypothetical protein ACFVT1_00635 [Streptomyces sp. NPDC057963]|uniref:hypothetical protein n=1 Tax=Streptomyces sp. NPDC057963 TaxID=3346290 RepID=UPI0036E9D76B
MPSWGAVAEVRAACLSDRRPVLMAGPLLSVGDRRTAGGRPTDGWSPDPMAMGPTGRTTVPRGWRRGGTTTSKRLPWRPVPHGR